MDVTKGHRTVLPRDPDGWFVVQNVAIVIDDRGVFVVTGRTIWAI